MIGVDLVVVSRIQKMIDKFGNKALKKFLSDDEIELAKNKTESIAGFYAAKEALSKALGTGIGEDCSFHDICISKTPKNAPYLKLDKKIIKQFNIIDSSVSITHDGGLAIAIVALEIQK